MNRQPFHVIAKPVGPVCNLDCDYCFYLEKAEFYQKSINLDSFKMSEEVLEQFIKQYIEAQPEELEELNFVWQGGEPALAGLDFYKKVIEFQEKYKRSGIAISNAFQTNGTLLDDQLCSFLHDNEFLVGISIDGPEKLHDAFRKNLNGKGSFAQVMKGVENLHKHQVQFNTMTMIHSRNVMQPERVYRFLKGIGSVFLQFIPCVEARTDSDPFTSQRCVDPRIEAAGVSSRSVPSMKFGSFMNRIFDLWLKGDIGSTFVQLFDNTLANVYGVPSGLCVFREECGRALTVEHNGDIYSCDHFTFPENMVGNIMEKNLGDIVDQPCQAEFGKKKSLTLPQQCHDCLYHHLCFGGCPSDRIMFADDGKKINYLCDGYRLFYTHTYKYFKAMADAIKAGRTAADYMKFL